LSRGVKSPKLTNGPARILCRAGPLFFVFQCNAIAAWRKRILLWRPPKFSARETGSGVAAGSLYGLGNACRPLITTGN